MPGFRSQYTGGCGVSSREAHSGHSHSPPGAGHRRALAVVLGISGTILAVEVIGAFVSGSLALLADAGHMLTDVAGVSLALVAAVLAGRPATEARTWGYRRAEVLAAAAQAAVLLAMGGFVLVEAIRRLIEPAPVASGVTSTNYTNTGLTHGVTYSYVVSASNGGV